MEKDAELIGVTAAAARKGVSRTSVYDAIKDGRLPHRIEGVHYYLLASDVDAWTPLTPAQRKGLPIGGRPKTQPKRKPGRPRNQPQEGATA